MVGESFRVLFFDGIPHGPLQLLTSLYQESVIGNILDECMLKVDLAT